MTDSRLHLAAIALAAAAVAAPARAHRHGPTTTSGEQARTCSDMDVRFGDRGALTAEQTLTIPGGAHPKLRLSASENGGVWVAGSDRTDFSIRVCKAVPDDAEGREALSRIQAKAEQGELRLDGPNGDDWVAQLIIQAPKSAEIEVSGVNGPISLRDLDGAVTVRAENGPVSCMRCRGTTTIHCQNGPVNLRETAGAVDADVENGPVSLELSGGAWNGKGARITCRNGPVSLRVPDGYGSGVLVETSDHSPFHCRGAGCESARKNWDDDRRSMRLGKGATQVTISTENGPVHVEAGS
jgi:hypothetical protein